MRKALPILAILFLIPAAACTDTGASIPGTVVDSAGVSIRTISDADLSSAPNWRLGEVPTVSIGEPEGEPHEMFAYIVGALRLRDGRIAIADGMTGDVRIHDAAGAYLGSFGRPGEGPGEFGMLWGLHRMPGDSLLAWDAALRRATVIAPDIQFARSFPVESIDDATPEIRGVLADGTVLIGPEDGYKYRDMNMVRRDLLPLLASHSETGAIDTVGWFPGQEQYELLVDPMLLLQPTPFGADTRISPANDGILVADNARPEIALVDRDGTVRSLIRIGREPRAVTAGDREAFREANIDESWRPSYLDAMRQFLDEAPVPSAMPHYREVIVGNDGSIWVADYLPDHELANESRSWLVFSGTGELRARITTPARFSVRWVGADFVLGTTRDDLDVERVVMYEITR